jgi:hypothetical protein
MAQSYADVLREGDLQNRYHGRTSRGGYYRAGWLSVLHQGWSLWISLSRATNVDHRPDSTRVEGHSPANGIPVGRCVSPLVQQSYKLVKQNLTCCPLFLCADVCNSRYNEDRRGEERGNHFVKIKNWGSCVPEVSLVPELRHLFGST